ncbi:MAG: hypothetical protein WC538_20090 [Thermoanaerobaculia bacterium]
MKTRAPFVLAALTTLVTLPLPADCGCANAPCEQTTLQSAIAREDLSGAFGSSLAPMEAVAPSGSMSLDFNSATDGGSELAAAFLLALFLFPFVFAFSRLVAYNDRLVLLRIAMAESTPRRQRPAQAAGLRTDSAPLLGAGAPS